MIEFSESGIVSVIAVIGTLAVISLISVLWYKQSQRENG
jgi:hypothetical protein